MKKELLGWLYTTIKGTTTYTVGGNSYKWSTLTGATGSTPQALRLIPAHLIDHTAMQITTAAPAYASIGQAGTTRQSGKLREDDETVNVDVFAALGDTDTLADVALYIKYAVQGNTTNDPRYKVTITPWLAGSITAEIGAPFKNEALSRHQVTVTITFTNVYQNGG